MTNIQGTSYSCSYSCGINTIETSLDIPIGTSTFFHSFSVIGETTITVNCSNDVSSISASQTVEVEERITHLRLLKSGQDKDVPVVIPWTVDTGSNITWTALITSPTKHPLEVLENHTDLNKHSFHSASLGKLDPVILTVQITASNNINSESLTETYEITSEIINFIVTASTHNTTTGQMVTFTYDMDQGSNVNVAINYNDGLSDNEQYSGEWSGTADEFAHAFINGDDYRVTVLSRN